MVCFVVVKFLKFPVVKYLNSTKRRRIAQTASTVAIIVFAASIYMFFNLFKQNQFKQSANQLIKDLKSDGISIIDERDKNIDYKNKKVTIFIYGNKLNKEERNKWKAKLPKYGLAHTKLIFQQGIDDSDIRNKVKNLTDLYALNQEIISSRDESIKEKEDKIKLLESEISKYYKEQIPFTQISKEAQVLFNGLAQIGYAKFVTTNFKTSDTISVFDTKWHDSIPNTNLQEIQLNKWLKTRLKLDTLVVTKNP